MATEPDEITVIVVSAKGLQGKKADRHKYSVIFGVGSKKYRTSVVKEPTGAPEWNEESVIHVNNILDQVFFIVTEKEDVLGQVCIPITSLQGPPGRNIRSALQPHKKCSNPKGEVVYQCYVSNRRPANQHIIDTKSPTLSGKYKRERRGSTLSSLNKKFSKSITNLLSFAKSHDEHNDSKAKSKLGLSINSGLDSAGKIPVIMSVSPSYALTNGGTRITIIGRNLGYSKSDIMDLTICEVDCTESIEYESSTKIYCTTRSTLTGKGDVILETESGGIGTLRNCFTFCDKLPENGGNPFDSDNPFADDMIGDEDVSFTVGSTHASPELQPKLLSVSMSHKRNASSSDIVMTTPTSPKSKKHFIKHIRRASEGHALNQLKNGPVKGTPPPIKGTSPPTDPPPVAPPRKVDQLNQEIERLKTENDALKLENKDMKSYIEKLVTKVMQCCPEALETDKLGNKYSY